MGAQLETRGCSLRRVLGAQAPCAPGPPFPGSQQGARVSPLRCQAPRVSTEPLGKSAPLRPGLPELEAALCRPQPLSRLGRARKVRLDETVVPPPQTASRAPTRSSGPPGLPYPGVTHGCLGSAESDDLLWLYSRMCQKEGSSASGLGLGLTRGGSGRVGGRVRVGEVTRRTERSGSHPGSARAPELGHTDALTLPRLLACAPRSSTQHPGCTLGGRCPVGQVLSRSSGSPMGVGSLLPGKRSSRSPTHCSPQGRRGPRLARRWRPLPITGGGATLPRLERPGPRCAEEKGPKTI